MPPAFRRLRPIQARANRLPKARPIAVKSLSRKGTHTPAVTTRDIPAVLLTCLLLLLGSASYTAAQMQHAAAARKTASSGAARKDQLQRALAAYDAGQSAEAESLLRSYVATDPDSYPAQEALGSLYAEGGALDRALPHLEKACALAPHEAIAHANLGAAYLKSGSTKKAVTELEKAVALDPTNATNQSNLGQALMLDGKPGEAARAFGAVVALDPANVDAHYNWAVALEAGGSLKPADDALGSIPPASISDQTEALRGEVDERLGDYQNAAVHLQRAAELNPSEDNLYALTAEFLRHWTWGPAIKMAQFGAARYPASKRLQLALAVGYYGNNQYAETATTASALLARDPDNSMYADLLGRSCSLLAEGTAATCNDLQAFALRHPQNARIATYAATNILNQPEANRNADLAGRLLAQSISADPALPEAYYEKGVLEQQRSDWQASTVSLEKAVALRPEYAEAHYRLARAYSHLGQRDRATAEIALQQQYTKQEKSSLDARLKEVTTFLVGSQ